MFIRLARSEMVMPGFSRTSFSACAARVPLPRRRPPRRRLVVVLVDGDASDARARALDAATAAALRGDGGWVRASDDPRDLAGSAAVVIAGGDVAAVRVSATQVAEHAPDAMVVVAAEPMETL